MAFQYDDETKKAAIKQLATNSIPGSIEGDGDR